MEDTEDVRDWKWMFRISSNWRTGMLVHLLLSRSALRISSGRCSTEQWDPLGQANTSARLVSSDAKSYIKVLLVGPLTVASVIGQPQPSLSLVCADKTAHSLSCQTRRSDSNTLITTLALDQSPLGTSHRVRVAAFLSTGEYVVFSIDHLRPAQSSRLCSYLPALTVPRVAPVIQAVFHDTLVATLSESFHLSLYDLSTGSIVHTQTLSSFTSYPPTSLVLTPVTATTYKLILAYAIPVYPAHWSVGATELMISSELSSMTVASTRTIRAFDISAGWIDERKLRAMREQWGRKVAHVADTQTDGKWVVLAPADALPARDSEDSITASPSAYPSSSLFSPSSLQLYRLSFPSSTSASSVPKLTFVRSLHGQMGPCSALALADGRCVSLGVNGSIWVWDLEGGTGTEVYEGRPASSDEKRSGAVAAVKGTVVFDERRIISADTNRVEIRRFDI